MIQLTDLIGSILDNNCLPTGCGFIRFRIVLVLETAAAETGLGHKTIHDYNSSHVD